MEVWKKIVGYITFRKAAPGEPTSENLRIMHGINKISLLVFLFAIVLMVVKWLT